MGVFCRVMILADAVLLLHVHLDDVDQLLGGHGALRGGVMVGIDDVKADVTFDDLRHQGVNGSAASCDRVQDLRAFGALRERLFNGVDLPANPADAVQELVPVSNDVRQGRASRGTTDFWSIVYPGRYSVLPDASAESRQ